MIIPVLLSGGSGTRLWPLSVPEHPKQFLPLTGPESLFQQTLQRVRNPQVYAPPIVVANAAHEALCQDELADVTGAELILEPVARNTAVAIVMAACLARARSEEALILVMPSDHRIGHTSAFHEAVQVGSAAAKDGHLVTFGITPAGPETGYGYLQAGESLVGHDQVTAVSRFIEKPSLEIARELVADDRHFWNGGIFLFSASAFLSEAEAWAPEVHRSGVRAMAATKGEQSPIRPGREYLEGCPDISVDYAIMERSSKVAMVPLDAEWSDVGSWDALSELPIPGNATAPVTMLDCNGCYVRSDGAKVAMVGVEDLIVVATGDRVVIMRKGQSQEIKRLAALAAAE